MVYVSAVNRSSRPDYSGLCVCSCKSSILHFPATFTKAAVRGQAQALRTGLLFIIFLPFGIVSDKFILQLLAVQQQGSIVAEYGELVYLLPPSNTDF